MTDNGNLPSHLTAWLHRLSADEPVVDVQPPMKSLSREAADCLRHAAECYVRAGGHAGAGRDRANWLSMACTMFEQIGDHSRAAAGREQLGQWVPAARAWSRAEKWDAAARCFLNGDRPEDAADCHQRDNHVIEAAWTLARYARRYRRARALTEGLVPEEPLDRVELDIVHAACDVGEGLNRAAAQRLRRSVVALLALSDSRRLPLLDRAIEVAETLGRPELIALLHASATSRRLPNALSRWKHWAEQWSDDHEMFSYQGEELAAPIADFDRSTTDSEARGSAVRKRSGET